jgi:hypothetical protein
MNLLKCACCIIGMCSVFISCQPKCQDDPNLNATELSWIPYNGGETLIFKSAVGNYDTFIVGQKNFQIHSIRDNEYEDNISCKYTSEELNIKVGLFNLAIAHKNMDVTYTAPEYNSDIGADGSLYIDANVVLNNSILDSVSLNGKTFYNVYKFYKALYYSKQQGIIAFYTSQNNPDSLYVKIN